MRSRLQTVVAVAAIYLTLSAGFVNAEEVKKVGILERIKKSYNDFKKRGQQKTQVVKKEALPLKPVNQPMVKTPKKEMTKEDLLAAVKEELAGNEEVFDMVPGLKADKDADGKVFYTYKGMKLEDLSKEDLSGLLTRAGQAMVRVRTERIQNQLDAARRVQTLQRPATVPQLPRIPTQVQLPRTPSAPPSAPRTPPSPPTAPQRR